jgi:hypothetical protein
VNLALIRIKAMEATPASGMFVIPTWVPVVGLATSTLLILVDLHA